MTTVHVALVRPESKSMAIGHGIDAGNGDGVMFGLETRAAITIAQALDAGEDVVVHLEPYQVIRRTPAVAA